MPNKELIISLIQQDLKHSQLILGLDELGLEASDKHCLEILDIVANLMQVPDGDLEHVPIAIGRGRVYITYMAESKRVGVHHTSETMRPFAEACYEGLVQVIS